MADVKYNDCSILNHMLAFNVQEYQESRIECDDIFIVNGGFRFSLECVEGLG